MPVYPSAVPSIPTNGSWTHDQVADEVEAIAGELGVNPRGVYTSVADRLATSSRRIVRPEFGNYKAWNFPPMLAAGRAAPAASGIVHGFAVPVTNGLVINSITFGIGLGGSGFTAGQNFVGLYDAAGNRVAQSADISASITGTGIFTVSLTAPYTVGGAASDLLWVAFLLTATTLPQIAGATANTGAITVGYAGRVGSTVYTSLPATVSPVFTTNFPTAYWVALS